MITDAVKLFSAALIFVFALPTVAQVSGPANLRAQLEIKSNPRFNVPGKPAIHLQSAQNGKPAFSVVKQQEKIKELMGGVNGGGGDEVGPDFESSLLHALDILKRFEPKLYAELIKRNVWDVLPTVRYVTVDKDIIVTINGIKQKSTASFDAENRLVIIDRNRWLKIDSRRAKESIALHELMGILEFEYSGVYRISSLYKSIQFNVVCESIVADTDDYANSPSKMKITILRASLEEHFDGDHGIIIEHSSGVSTPQTDNFGDYLIVHGNQNVFKAEPTGHPYYPQLGHYMLSGELKRPLKSELSLTMFMLRKENDKFILTVGPADWNFFKSRRKFECQTVRY